MIDLHVHTTCSDGTCSVGEVIDLACRAGLSAVAVTDHDTVRGLAEALAAGERVGITVVPGIEINAKYEGFNTHIVGLFVDHKSSTLRSFCERLVRERASRNLLLIDKLRTLGYDVDEGDFEGVAEGKVLTKGSFGEVLVNKGYFDTVAEAVNGLMVKDAPAYVPKVSCTPFEAVDAIHAAGGLAFVAHFHQICRSDIDRAERITRLILDGGADGLETRYSEFDDALRARAESIAASCGALRSGGSDFHGTIKPHISIGTGMGGLCVPDEYLDAIRGRLGRS